MARDQCLFVFAAVACASAPAVQALSPVAAGVLRAEQRWSKPATQLVATPAQPSRSRSSLCREGKLIPEFYVLGFKNTATSSLSYDLVHRGVISAPQNETKEWWFFIRQGNKPVAEQEREWLQSFPPCPSERVVMADFSVTNIFNVPFPEDLHVYSEIGFGHLTMLPYWNAASLIRKFSGDAAKDLQFLLLLREPLARSQSEYYHTLPLHNCYGCMANDSFAESFAFNVGLLQQSPPQVSDWFWRSFYARQIEEYLRHFDAAQFAFVPNQLYFSKDPPAFSAALLDRLDVQAEPWDAASHWNSHDMKPPLDVELPLGTASREAFQAFFAAENDRLVKALARAHLGGAWLPGYTGEPGDEVLVRAWLESNW